MSADVECVRGNAMCADGAGECIVAARVLLRRYVNDKITGMNISIKVGINSSNGRFMGSGPYELLTRVDRTGSIRKAAAEMELSYAKAHKMIARLEKELGIKVLNCRIGGNDRGGAELTDFGRRFLNAYEELQKDCKAQAEILFEKHFGDIAAELANSSRSVEPE